MSDLVEKSKVVVKEMLEDRGYEVEEWEEDEFYVEGEGRERILVLRSEDASISTISNVEKRMSSEGLKRVILISVKDATTISKETLKNLSKNGKKIEIFTLAETSFNLSKNSLVPKHEIVSKREKEELLNAYNISPKNLPLIKKTDPMVRYLGANPGQLLRITSESLVNGLPTISYRIVTS